jgi:hypothetical protein
LYETSTKYNQPSEYQPAEPRVWRASRIRDHKEGEKQQGAALESMPRDRPRFSKVRRSAEKQQSVAYQKRERDICAACPVHNQQAEAHEQEGKDGGGTPLASRTPGDARTG